MTRANRWHDESERERHFFNEWVYFSFASESLRGMIIYGCAAGHPGVVAVQIFPGELVDRCLPPCVAASAYRFGPSEVDRAPDRHDVRIGDCRLVTETAGYRIEGQLCGDEGGGSAAGPATTVEWKLQFDRTLPAVDGFEAPFGTMWFEHFGWRVLSPRARVSGEVRVAGRAHVVDAMGYVDTNWGRWCPGVSPRTDWNWIAASSAADAPPMAVVGLGLRSFPTRGALVWLDSEEQIRFELDPETFRHTRFAPAIGHGFLEPVETRITARSAAGHRLDAWVTTRADHVYEQVFPLAELGLPIPRLAIRWPIVESFVTVEGELTHPGGDRRHLHLTGQKEYGITSWLPRPVRRALLRRVIGR